MKLDHIGYLLITGMIITVIAIGYLSWDLWWVGN